MGCAMSNLVSEPIVFGEPAPSPNTGDFRGALPEQPYFVGNESKDHVFYSNFVHNDLLPYFDEVRKKGGFDKGERKLRFRNQTVRW